MALFGDVVAHLRQRGLLAQSTHDAPLRDWLAQAPRTFYVGYDPTGPSLHAGHLVTLMALRLLAKAGHRPIALVGGATARIGDPSHKSEARVPLSPDAIAANAQAIGQQIERLVGGGHALQMVNNETWLAPLGALAFLADTGRHFSVARMLGAETYKSRLQGGLTFFEFGYQLLQAHDFAELHKRYDCRLQLGGDDQWSNILGGVELCRRLGLPQAFGLTVPLVTTANGRKMGKTQQGAVWLDAARTSPAAFYQYWVNTADTDLLAFLRLFTELPSEQIDALAHAPAATLNVAKNVLAFEATRWVHGEAAAHHAHHAALSAFGARQLHNEVLPSSGMPRHSEALLPQTPHLALPPQGVPLWQALVGLGWAKSNNEARRLITQGGVSVGGQRMTDPLAVLHKPAETAEAVWLRAGKKRAVRLR